MPRRPIHPYPPEAPVVPPNNDPVVAQDTDLFSLGPQPCRRALPRPRMPDEQVANPVGTDDPAAMQFYGFFLGKAVHDEQLIEWIFEGLWRGGKLSKELLAHLQRGLAEGMIDQKLFVRVLSENRSADVELKP